MFGVTRLEGSREFREIREIREIREFREFREFREIRESPINKKGLLIAVL